MSYSQTLNLLLASSTLTSLYLAHRVLCTLASISQLMSKQSAWIILEYTMLFRTSPSPEASFYLAYMKKDRERPTLLSLNRFEKKKNAALALKAFALIQNSLSVSQLDEPLRLVLAGKLFLSS